MITYNYVCQNCNTNFEIKARSFEDMTKHPKCPNIKCGSVAVIKVIGISPTIFKGSGFSKVATIRKGES